MRVLAKRRGQRAIADELEKIGKRRGAHPRLAAWASALPPERASAEKPHQLYARNRQERDKQPYPEGRNTSENTSTLFPEAPCAQYRRYRLLKEQENRPSTAALSSMAGRHIAKDGYLAAAKAITQKQEFVTAEVVRRRAAARTHRRQWRPAKAPGRKFTVCNADEGDPARLWTAASLRATRTP